MTDFYSDDRKSLQDIIENLFADLSWGAGGMPDWASFKAAFRDDAVLYPSARPAVQTPLAAFVDRMEEQRRSGGLRSIIEKPLKLEITVFGNTALVYASYIAEINGGAPARGANAFLFTRDEGQWRIGALAWDNESPDAPLPAQLSA